MFNLLIAMSTAHADIHLDSSQYTLAAAATAPTYADFTSNEDGHDTNPAGDTHAASVQLDGGALADAGASFVPFTNGLVAEVDATVVGTQGVYGAGTEVSARGSHGVWINSSVETCVLIRLDATTSTTPGGRPAVFDIKTWSPQDYTDLYAVGAGDYTWVREVRPGEAYFFQVTASAFALPDDPEHTSEAFVTLTVVELTGDLDGDGLVDLSDISAFVTAAEAGDATADLDRNGLVDLTDISWFATLAQGACPAGS